MKKIYIWSILTLIITTFLPTTLLAQESTSAYDAGSAVAQHETHVTPAQALNVGYTFMRTGDGSKGNGTKSGSVSKQAMQLIYTGQAYDSLTGITTDCYYVFALQPKGFVIVAADDRVEPILGYSYDNDFMVANMPDHVRGWLGNYEKQIEAVAKSNLQPTPETQTKWARLKSGQAMSSAKSGGSVGPLLTTQWDQWWPYNALCPEGMPVGCTGTATAQIVNYWQYPSKGVGYYSYEPRSGVGEQSAWFNETYYQWDSMDVNHVEAISTLNYQVAVASHMDFDAYGSGAQIYYAEAGLQDFFDYSDSSFFADKDSYSDEDWDVMLINDLDNGRPVLYDGFNSGYTTGHAWVVDGYDENGLFHMNFGWSGASDGYYAITGQPNGFNYYQGAVFGIQPAYSNLSAEFQYSSTNSVLEYRFIDFSKGNATTYNWSFGDGETSSLQNPVHQFASEGTYTTTLIVGNNLFFDTVTKYIYIEKTPLYPTNYYIAPNAGNVAVLDYDMDGRYDLYTQGYLGIYLYHNEDTIFRNVPNIFNAGIESRCNAKVVDLNNENRPSILSSNNNGFFLYNNNGTLEPSQASIFSIVNNLNVFSTGDYDGDGDEDVLIYYGEGNFNGIGTLYKNVGMHYVQVDTVGYSAQMWYDYDGDGDLDLIGRTIYRNDGEDIFTPVFSVDGGSGLRIDVSDMNIDGKPDIVFGDIVVYNLGNDIFMQERTIPYSNSGFVMSSTSTYAVDFDCDGVSDITTLSDVNNTYANSGNKLYRNEIDSLHQVHIQQPQYWYSPNGSYIDFNNDNIPDYFHCGVYAFEANGDGVGFHSALMQNSCTTSNNPPSTPQNLWTDTSGNNVILHWDTVTDDHSRYGSITYNLMVGTAPDSFDIKSPLSNIETGKRYAYDKGNAGHAPLWKLNNLPNGTYYWRVQAIDNSLAASHFSEMGTFVINGVNFPPEMTGFTTNTCLNRQKLFSAQDFKDHYYDREGDTLQGIQVVSLPNHGTLWLNNIEVISNQLVSIDSIDHLSYITNVFEDDTIFIKSYNQNNLSADSAPIVCNVKLFENTFSLNDANGDVAWGDFNNDGLMDFASTVGIFKNTGAGFEKLPDSIPSSEHVLWADINNDGFLDCIFDGRVLQNSGAGHFMWMNTCIELLETGIAGGDINNDNAIDYYIGGLEDDWATITSKIYYNINGELSNDNVFNLSPGHTTGDAKFGDINNDGKQELIAMGIVDGQNTRETNIYVNQEDSLLIQESNIVNLNVGSIDLGDYDNDGDLDLLICGSKGTEWDINTRLYDNIGGGTFVEHANTSFAALLRGEAIWYDLDNDGFLDVLLTGISSGTRLYRNVNGNHFEEVNNTGLPDLMYSYIDVVDYDRDGFEDIIISGVDNNYIPFTGVFSNGYGDGVSQNTLNSVPTNLEAIVQGSSVVLSWDNDASLTTYNLYVKDANGFIVSPMADTVSGFRKVTDYGNTGYSKNYTLRNLQAGTYYWSVQTIDRNHKGSSFANEHFFSIVCDSQETIVTYDTACYAFVSEQGTYTQSGIYHEYYLGATGCDSIVERHIVISTECIPIIYVRTEGNDSNSGFSWTDALSDLQLGIDKAGEINGQVWVAQGIYYGDSVSENAFIVPDGVSLYGGFVGNEPADYDLSLRDLTKHPTILDGQHSQRTVYHGWTWSDIVPLVDGFTIQNGFSDGWGGNVSGGIPNINVYNCIIRGGEANDAGGVSNAVVQNSLIYDNISQNLAGAFNEVVATNCLLSNNSANLSECLYSTLKNCILWHPGGYDQSFTNNITYSAIENWDGSGEGNILLAHSNDGTSPDSNYVRFVDPENGDFRLFYGSACINAGTPDISTLGLPSVDLQGLPRVLDGHIDMGAYEYYPVPVVETYDTICEGNSVTFYGTEYAVEGVYSVHTNPDPMQDTMYVLHLTVYPADSAEFAETACGSYEWNGETFTTSGDYTRTLTNMNGCDSVVTLHLTIQFATSAQFADTACGSYEWNGQTYSSSGDYEQTFTAANGCDSIVTLHLTVNQPTTGTDVQTACGSYTWIDGITYTESNNTATYTLTNAVGCDSVVTLNLTIFPADSAEFAETACGSYEWNGETFTTSGDYTRTLTNMNGCDSVVTLHLTIQFATSAQFADTACGSYEWNGQTYSSSGDYEQTFTAANGCDSIVTLHLTVNQPNTGTDVQTACGSYTWIDGITYTESNNTATYTLTNAVGCDSVVTLNLTIFPADSAEFAETACDSYEWNGETFTSSGDYTRTLTNASGCDSVVTLHLTIQFATSAQFADTACGSYEWNGQNYTSSGDYEQTFTAANGCDSIVTLHLIINQPTTGTDVQTACGSYTWIDGITYTESNSTATHTLTNAIGCDSIVTLNLTIFPADSAEFAETACGSYKWNGETFTTTGDYTRTLTNASGCDSVVTLHLTIHFATSAQFADTTCGSYEWNGQNYTSSGDYEQTFTAANGCDSVVTLHLTVNQPTTGTDVQTACGSYTWIDGITYTESNSTATHTLTNAVGCDSVVTLNLTIFPADSAEFAETACDSFEWNGETFTSSGDFTRTLTNASGCDSVVTLHLTIQFATSAQFADTACGSYEWNGQTYSSSGDYEQTFTAANGCDSIVTLHLIINQPTTGTDVQTACGSYTWIDGITYTESNNTATYTLTNAVGCDSIVTLNLTIFPADSAEFAETACDSFEWNGETFTSSGDYTRTFTNASGCDSVVTLHLTIQFATSAQFADTACGSYEWNGQNYTSSGDYEQTFTAANGCDSVVTLHLTITVGIDDHNDFAFNLYPNPTHGMVNVQCTMNNVQVGAMEYHVFDAYGKLVDVVGTRCTSSLQTAQIDLSGFTAGVYFVKAVADGNVVAVRKVVKR